MGTILDGYPWWSQLLDPDPRTGRPDVWAATDCGEECVSVWLMGSKGLYTAAADLRRALTGNRVDGRTTGADLAYLLHVKGVKGQEMVPGPRGIKNAVRLAVARSSPVAILGRWIDPGILHWVLGIGYGDDALIAMEPWAGKLAAYRWVVVESLATGDLVQQASS